MGCHPRPSRNVRPRRSSEHRCVARAVDSDASRQRFVFALPHKPRSIAGPPPFCTVRPPTPHPRDDHNTVSED
eukprot:273828-Chlamydomonas_euryale.AAC.6